MVYLKSVQGDIMSDLCPLATLALVSLPPEAHLLVNVFETLERVAVRGIASCCVDEGHFVAMEIALRRHHLMSFDQ